MTPLHCSLSSVTVATWKSWHILKVTQIPQSISNLLCSETGLCMGFRAASPNSPERTCPHLLNQGPPACTHAWCGLFRERPARQEKRQQLKHRAVTTCPESSNTPPSPSPPENENVFINSSGFCFSTWTLKWGRPLRQPWVTGVCQSWIPQPGSARTGRGWTHHGTNTEPVPAVPGTTSCHCLPPASSAFHGTNQSTGQEN